MQRDAIIAALTAYRINRGSGVSEPLRAVDVVGIADAILEASPAPDPVEIPSEFHAFAKSFVAFQQTLLFVPTPEAVDDALLVCAMAFRKMALAMKDPPSGLDPVEIEAALMALRRPYVIDLRGLPAAKRSAVRVAAADLNDTLRKAAEILERLLPLSAHHPEKPAVTVL